MLGQFINLTNKTSYQLTLSARKVLKSALIAMRNYCNKYEWGVGISGRHPFGGSMKDDDIDAFAYLPYPETSRIKENRLIINCRRLFAPLQT